jgi:hypothetical protein
MLLRIAIALFIVSSLLGCSKESIVKPYSFLNLRVEGQEEDIKWETITSNWIDTLGKADVEATSYYFERCTIHLNNITSVGSINALTLMQFYYTDGLDFKPYSISGTLTITQANDKAIRGTFSLYMESNFNGFLGRKITGDFGVINNP